MFTIRFDDAGVKEIHFDEVDSDTHDPFEYRRDLMLEIIDKCNRIDKDDLHNRLYGYRVEDGNKTHVFTAYAKPNEAGTEWQVNTFMTVGKINLHVDQKESYIYL
jgi:hypothetical protein